MIDQGLNYADSTVKEMIDFSEIRVESQKPKEDEKNLPITPKKRLKGRIIRRGKEMFLNLLWYSLMKSHP